MHSEQAEGKWVVCRSFVCNRRPCISPQWNLSAHQCGSIVDSASIHLLSKEQGQSLVESVPRVATTKGVTELLNLPLQQFNTHCPSLQAKDSGLLLSITYSTRCPHTLIVRDFDVPELE